MDTKNKNYTPSIKTRKQVEREISQKFYAFYKQTLGCSPQKVICYVSHDYLIIIAEGAVSPLELTIGKQGQSKILLEMRQSINRVLKSQLEKIVEEIVSVGIIDTICDLNFHSERMMAMALLSEAPKLRCKTAKIKKSPNSETA